MRIKKSQSDRCVERSGNWSRHNCISRESQTTRNVLWSRASVCLSLPAAVCLRYCTDPDVTLGVVGDAPWLCTIGRICNRCMGCVAMAT